MDTKYCNILVDRLRRWNYTIAAGLSDSEVSDIEARYGFRFPPDLKFFLQQVLPISEGWVDWRSAPEEEIRRRLNWPLEGIIFDIEHNVFWLESWGQKPDNLAEAVEIAKMEVEKAPTLIPILSHRYIPDDPPLAGNPVFSVYQTDIIYYGYDLASYFENEFAEGQEGYHVSEHYHPDVFVKQPRPIRFWDQVIESWADERGHSSSVP